MYKKSIENGSLILLTINDSKESLDPDNESKMDDMNQFESLNPIRQLLIARVKLFCANI